MSLWGRPLIAFSLLCGAASVSCGSPPKPQAPVSPVVPAPKASAMPSTALPDRSQLPQPTALRDFTPPVPITRRLSNGIRFWHVEQGPTPLVALLLILPNGGATDPVGKEGLTALMADMLDEGVKGMSALEISDRLRFLAVDHSAEVDLDSTTLVMHTIAETFEPAVELLADFVLRPTLPKEEFDRRKEQRVSRALAAEAEPEEARALLLKRALFGDGYGGDLSRGTRATLKSITLEDVKAQFHKVIAPEGAELVVVGGIGEVQAREALERAFSKWHGKPTATARPLTAAPLKSGIHLTHFEGATQSTLTIARRADGANSPDYFKAMVFNRSFGGAFTSRVNMNLREDKGYTYGARSSFQRYKSSGYFSMSAAVKTEETRASVEETWKELREVCSTRPITEQERQESVSGLLLGLPGRYQTVGGVAAQVSSLPIYGREPNWLAQWPASVGAVTQADTNDVARRYCDPNDFVVVIAGDRNKVIPQFEGFGLPIFEYDALGKPIDPKAHEKKTPHSP